MPGRLDHRISRRFLARSHGRHAGDAPLTRTRLRAPRFAAVVALALAALSACSDGSPLTPAVPTPPAAPLSDVAVLRCSAVVATKSVECGQDAPGTSSSARFRLIGGQNVFLKLASTNVAYDQATQTYSADLTLKNLLVQRMGSDGTTVSGVRVFFHSGPVVTQGTGIAEVKNPDGMAAFTAGVQPYFEYAGSLGPQETSAAKRWEWTISPTVVRFDFTVLVEAQIVPTLVFDMMVAGNRDIYRMGIDGRDLTRLTTHAGDDRDPTVAGNRVVFTSYRDTVAELYEVPLTGGANVRLTATSDNETSPALSPDGSRLAFIRSNANVLGKLWIAPAGNLAAATQPTIGLGFGGDLETSPAWADSTRLAFVSTSLGSADLFTLQVGGSPVRMVSQSAQADVDPAYRPDGTVIFASNRGGDTELYLLDPGTGTVTRATVRTGSDSAPSWLSNGAVVFSCYQGSARGSRLCWVNPAEPAVITEIPTPAAADRPAGIRF